jgi:hypothetical protein
MESFASFDEFALAFAAQFGPTEADKQRYDSQLLRFRQADDETVVQYYTRFKNLCAELKAGGKPVQLHCQITTFINGLRDRIKREVSRIYTRDTSISLELLYTEAETEESLQQPAFKKPAFKKLQVNGRKKCIFRGDTIHDGTTCPKIAKKKANGTWKKIPPKNRGGAAE